mgnify:CR=1 FL=1
MQKLQIDFFNHDQNKHDYNNKYEVILISVELFVIRYSGSLVLQHLRNLFKMKH